MVQNHIDPPRIREMYPVRCFAEAPKLLRPPRSLGCDLNGVEFKKKPIRCMLGACSGQHPMGYRFSLLTLLFSGVCKTIKLLNREKFRLNL